MAVTSQPMMPGAEETPRSMNSDMGSGSGVMWQDVVEENVAHSIIVSAAGNAGSSRPLCAVRGRPRQEALG